MLGHQCATPRVLRPDGEGVRAVGGTAQAGEQADVVGEAAMVEQVDRIALKAAYLGEQFDRIELLISKIEPDYLRTSFG